MTWCTYLQSFEKIHQCVFELQCEKLNVTDRRTDRQTGDIVISPVRGPTARREIKRHTRYHWALKKDTKKTMYQTCTDGWTDGVR